MNINDINLKAKFQVFLDEGFKPNNEDIAALMGLEKEPIDMERFRRTRDEYNSLYKKED